jgi:hypothetical protein
MSQRFGVRMDPDIPELRNAIEAYNEIVVLYTHANDRFVFT